MSEWNVSIHDKEVRGGPQSGSFICDEYELTSFSFVEADFYTSPLCEYTYLMIDTLAWEEYWQNDEVSYIPKDLFSFPDYRQPEILKSARKVNNLISAVSTSKKIYSPSFKLSAKGAQLGISDGRHRIHLIRMLGIPAFPAAVPFSIIEELEKNDLLSRA